MIHSLQRRLHGVEISVMQQDNILTYLAEAFGFAPVELNEYLIAIGLGFCVIPIVELVKFIQRKLG